VQWMQDATQMICDRIC